MTAVSGAPSGVETPDHPHLMLEEDRQVALAAGGRVRVLTFRKVRGSTA